MPKRHGVLYRSRLCAQSGALNLCPLLYQEVVSLLAVHMASDPGGLGSDVKLALKELCQSLVLTFFIYKAEKVVSGTVEMSV